MNRASLAAAADARASSTPSEAAAARKDRERRGATARGRSPDDEAPTPDTARMPQWGTVECVGASGKKVMEKMAHTAHFYEYSSRLLASAAPFTAAAT